MRRPFAVSAFFFSVACSLPPATNEGASANTDDPSSDNEESVSGDGDGGSSDASSSEESGSGPGSSDAAEEPGESGASSTGDPSTTAADSGDSASATSDDGGDVEQEGSGSDSSETGESEASATDTATETNIVPVGATPDERHLLLRDEGLSRLHYVDLGIPANTWSVDIPVGRELQLVGDNRVLVGTENGYQERSVLDGELLDEVSTHPGTIAARRLRNGNTLLVGLDWQGATGILLLEVDGSGAEQDRVNFPQFGYVRLVRPTPSGTYLVTADATVFEGTPDGDVIWEVAVQYSTEPHAWKALRLPSGDTMVSTGYEASLQVFSPAEQMTERIRAPGEVMPNFFSDFQLLASGNILVANWQGHGTGYGASGRQVIELDRSGGLVWSWQQDPELISSLQAVILLDGLDLMRLHVEDTTGELLPVE